MKNCETVIPYFGRRDFQEPLVKLSIESKVNFNCHLH